MGSGNVRLRLFFEDRRMLDKSQKKDGLKRCWMLLEPQFATIYQLTFHITHLFDLEDTCPNGILLSMDGFVIPPFESTCIFKDKDIVCVKRKKGKLSDIIKVDGGENSSEEEEILEKQPAPRDVKLLANEEFEAETGGYESEPEVDEEDQSEESLHVESAGNVNSVSKKRKASTKLCSSKRKKIKYTTTDTEISPGVPEGVEDVENGVHAEHIESSIHPAVPSKRGLLQKYGSCEVMVKLDKEGICETGKRSENFGESIPSTKRFHPLDKDKGTLDASDLPGGTNKVPSRSARRKKAKRRWLRELAKVNKKELHQPQSLEKDNEQSPQKHNLRSAKKENGTISSEHQQDDRTSDVDDDIVPIIIRPGHIRFEARDKGAEPVIQHNQIIAENFQWNGITSKKKGQKWGKEKAASNRRNSDDDLNQEVSSWDISQKNFQWNGITSKKKGQKWDKEKAASNRRNSDDDLKQEVSRMLTTEAEEPVNHHIDFDKLMPYAGLPKEGDVVAYRLIELSSSWCPEVSSFRVGKVSWYNPEANTVTLVPVPQHPVVFEEKIDEEASGSQPAPSLYKEDGSLEIEFPSLVDVRIVKHGNLHTAKPVSGTVNGIRTGDKDAVQDSTPNYNNEYGGVLPPGNVDVNAWEEISRALSAKKAQLSQEDSWKKDSSGKNSWSYKALRGSALGPTMALLRAQNEL